MTGQIKHKFTMIRNSCLTGVAVWVYLGASASAARRAYQRACRHELEHVRHVAADDERRKSNIVKILNDCMAGIGITGELSEEQKSAARQLLANSEECSTCRGDFYDHIVEERRRMKIPVVLPEKSGNGENEDYDK